ncbi:MAG: hypothetical protein EXR73_07270 [Myxococcales bacterium]|nr:hypothetical protein [Myxococcales bacterium]
MTTPVGIVRRRRPAIAVIAVAALASLTQPARAWEPETTHAGLTEAAALGSGLALLFEELLGLELGWYETLALPPGVAPEIDGALRHLPTTEGYVPDALGRQAALGWLVAGSVIEDLPAGQSRRHFHDPVHGVGLTGATASGPSLFERLAGAPARPHGGPAADWVIAAENPLGLHCFLDRLAASTTDAAPARRQQELARALVCAGAMLHVLEDVGSPSRARDDLRAHLEPLGGGAADQGSRFERLAATLHGRLGIAPATRLLSRTRLRDHFTAADRLGLADHTSARYFSLGTLPAPLELSRRDSALTVVDRLRTASRFPLPASFALDLVAAARAEGAVLRDADGVCLAHYRLARRRLNFSLPPDCATEQLAAILPDVANRAAGFLAYLFRGRLKLSASGQVTVDGVALGAGTLTLLAEDAAGTRRVVGQPAAVAGGAAGAVLHDFANAERAVERVAIFRGVDAAGEALVALGRSD